MGTETRETVAPLAVKWLSAAVRTMLATEGWVPGEVRDSVMMPMRRPLPSWVWSEVEEANAANSSW